MMHSTWEQNDQLNITITAQKQKGQKVNDEITEIELINNWIRVELNLDQTKREQIQTGSSKRHNQKGFWW